MNTNTDRRSTKGPEYFLNHLTASFGQFDSYNPIQNCKRAQLKNTAQCGPRKNPQLPTKSLPKRFGGNKGKEGGGKDSVNLKN